MTEKTIEIPLEKTDDSVVLPRYASEGASGADVHAHIGESIEIAPGTSAMIPTGIKLEIPVGFEIQVRPRSGLAAKHMISVLNTPGTIDADYRGEIKVILINYGKESFVVEPGMRIAQLVLAPVYQAAFLEAAISETARGEGGFGHTGLHST